MQCGICKQKLAEDDDIENCPECQQSFHGEELARQLQDDPTCVGCGNEFEPYTIFEFTDKYDFEAKPQQNYSPVRGYALNGIFGLFPPKITVILSATLFFGTLFVILISYLL